MKLDEVAIVQDMLATDSLTFVAGASPKPRELQLLSKFVVDSLGKVFDRCPGRQSERIVIDDRAAGCFCINPHDIQC